LLILDESQDGSAHRLCAKRVHRSQHETGAHHYTKHVFAHGCFLHSVLPVWGHLCDVDIRSTPLEMTSAVKDSAAARFHGQLSAHSFSVIFVKNLSAVSQLPKSTIPSTGI